ncbi:MAG: histidine phosphatase family protein [Clostridia bacterium]|nr:histidine phosphatase family protein [Clostridia bacterium]MBQ8357391.1 histidine phosphatase family protein [Clostridia bacterium]
MRILFVRHGNPNYKDDCLTELGHLQAAAVAKRLVGEGIEQIYTSTCGRASETAEYTSRELGLPAIPLDFMREISGRSIDGTELYAKGNPWEIARWLVSKNESIIHRDWAEREPFCHGRLKETVVDRVIKGFDPWLAQFGYVREGEHYRVIGEDTAHTVAVFSHGGSSTAVLCHLFNLPFIQGCAMFRIDQTSVTEVVLPDRPGELITPELWLLNDMAHAKDIEVDHTYGGL